VIVRAQARISQCRGLSFIQHAERAARLHSEGAHAAHMSSTDRSARLSARATAPCRSAWP
jgi:hypothetical protein